MFIFGHAHNLNSAKSTDSTLYYVMNLNVDDAIRQLDAIVDGCENYRVFYLKKLGLQYQKYD